MMRAIPNSVLLKNAEFGIKKAFLNKSVLYVEVPYKMPDGRMVAFTGIIPKTDKTVCDVIFNPQDPKKHFVRYIID